MHHARATTSARSAGRSAAASPASAASSATRPMRTWGREIRLMSNRGPARRDRGPPALTNRLGDRVQWIAEASIQTAGSYDPACGRAFVQSRRNLRQAHATTSGSSAAASPTSARRIVRSSSDLKDTDETRGAGIQHTTHGASVSMSVSGLPRRARVVVVRRTLSGSDVRQQLKLQPLELPAVATPPSEPRGAVTPATLAAAGPSAVRAKAIDAQ